MHRTTPLRQTLLRPPRRARRLTPPPRPATRLRWPASPVLPRPHLVPLLRFPRIMVSASERASRLLVGLALTSPLLSRAILRSMRMFGLRPASAPALRAAPISGLLPTSATRAMRTIPRLFLSRVRRAHRSFWTMPCALSLTASACAYALPMPAVTSSTARLRAPTTKS